MSLSPEQIKQRFPHVSASTLRANGGLIPKGTIFTGPGAVNSPIRQRRKKGSKLQAAFVEHLRARNVGMAVLVLGENFTVELGNGCRYTPDAWEVTIDVAAEGEAKPVYLAAYEVKGPHKWDDAIVKLKVAPRAFPWISFYLVTLPDRAGPWRIERVLP